MEKIVLKTVDKYNMLSPGDTIVIGLSGGADSVALLTVLCALKQRYNITLHAAHINHMIRGNEAERDAKYAKSIAEANGVEFHLLKCNVPAMAEELGISEEMAGRKARYDFFNSISTNAKIAVAHHKGDSAETTLINMMRGSSLNGLKGISPVNGNIVRPLIECDRCQIEKYLLEKNISFVTDSTNAENIYTRNIVRNVIIPAMEKINPNLISTIYENSRILADDEDFISSVCAEYENKCISTNDNCIVLNLENNMHISLKRRLVMRSCEILSGSRQGISSDNIESVLSLPTGGKTFFHGIYTERSYDRFIFSQSVKNAIEFSYNITSPCTLSIPETNKTYLFEIIQMTDLSAYENGVIYLDADKLGTLTVRSRKNGDIFSPIGLGGRKKVKDFLIDLKIPRHLRATLPILETDGKTAAILCQRADDAYKVTTKTTKILKISEGPTC
ncbi:MAG: tRNA lysidine(34) synthetase TilS [Clostridia bacterium]|nr:tRNA lysidine(34) synthetase TilS [Clostridia bacterium]